MLRVSSDHKEKLCVKQVRCTAAIFIFFLLLLDVISNIQRLRFVEATEPKFVASSFWNQDDQLIELQG